MKPSDPNRKALFKVEANQCKSPQIFKNKRSQTKLI